MLSAATCFTMVDAAKAPKHCLHNVDDGATREQDMVGVEGELRNEARFRWNYFNNADVGL